MNKKNSGLLVFLALLTVVSGPAQTRKAETHPANLPESTKLIESLDGAVLYKAYCASCHGMDAKGIGPMTQWLKIVSPDLTRIGIRAGGTFPLVRVQRIISGEESAPQGHGTREMPVWGPIFSQVAWDQDLGRMRVYNLAKFLEQMQVKK